MTYLQQEDFGMVLELLKKAEILTERDEAGRAVTYNNLACYYRRQGKLHAALSYLQKALRIESRLQHVYNPADTHLNMCAVLSQLGRHAGKLKYLLIYKRWRKRRWDRSIYLSFYLLSIRYII